MAAPRVRLPRPRLTALGSGLFAGAAMVVFAGLDALAGGSATAYGVAFVLVSALAALWISPADLFMAPIAAPLTYTAGLLVVLSGASAGPADALMSVATALAVHAGWVYGGTLVACAVALSRRLPQASAGGRR